MPYTAPPTHATGDVFPASDWNTYVRDNTDFGMVRPIAHVLVGSSVASIDFVSIPATFAHLLFVLYARADVAAALVGCGFRFNSDSGANYDSQVLYGTGTSSLSGEAYAGIALGTTGFPGASAPANVFNCAWILIPNYAGTANNKVCFVGSALKVGVATGNLYTEIRAGFWRSNAAINRFTIYPASGNLVAGTVATLYGMGSI